MARTRYMARFSRVIAREMFPVLVRAASSLSERMPVSRHTAISSAAQEIISCGSSFFRRAAQAA